jgi:hypothetical protein
MSVWSPTGSGNVHYDQVLTNISLGFPNNAFVGENLFPTVTVAKQTAKYYIFGREAWVAETSDHRAPGTEANEIPGFTASLDTFYCAEHALQMAVTDEEREMVDSQFVPDRDATNLLTSKILLGREVAMQGLVSVAANYATGLSTTFSEGTTQWNDYTGSSHPITNIRTGMRAVHRKIFMEPNLAIIPYLVMSYLEDHPDIIERIKYSERAILTPEIIAAVFGIQRVIVPGVGVGTAAPGALGDAVSVGYLWSDDVILAWVPPAAGLKIPAFAYEYAWTFGGQSMATDRWREERRASDLIRVRRRYDLKLTGVEINSGSGDYGKVVTGYLLKNVLGAAA